MPERPIEILRSPITLRRGELLADRRLQLAPDFAWTPVMAAIYVESPDVTIRNVHLIGSSSWLSRWNRYNELPKAPPGIAAGTSGIRLQGAPRVHIEGVHIEGFPSIGVPLRGVADRMLLLGRPENPACITYPRRSARRGAARGLRRQRQRSGRARPALAVDPPESAPLDPV